MVLKICGEIYVQKCKRFQSNNQTKRLSHCSGFCLPGLQTNIALYPLSGNDYLQAMPGTSKTLQAQSIR